jgi:solute carrier family 25 carnitine/acylcarnitine transporter 20/29
MEQSSSSDDIAVVATTTTTTLNNDDDAVSSVSGVTEVTAFHDLIAGGIAGSASVVVGHPFDTIKVRMQVSSGSGGGGSLGSLFRGMAAPLSTAAIVNAIIFSSYGASSRLWDAHIGAPEDEHSIHDPWQKAFACGSVAGLVQAIVICPMEHLKCRLQVQQSPATTLYNGPYPMAKHIVTNYGLMRGLYRGWWCTTIREVPAFGAYFAIYDVIKDWITVRLEDRQREHHEQLLLVQQQQQQQQQLAVAFTSTNLSLAPIPYEDHPHTWLASAFAGGLTGCITWAAIYPVDVIKTRIQTSPLDTQVRMMQVGRDIIRQHGWKYMFRGLGITMIRAFPVNGIIFPCYEFVLKHITTY